VLHIYIYDISNLRVDCIYYSTVVHKGFPSQQDVVKAIGVICGPPQAGKELDFRQKEDFLDFIRGESDRSHYEFCTFWVITLVL